MKRHFLFLIIAAGTFAIPFLVYLYTLSPAIAPGDSTEMVTAAVVLGVPHQPSYPVNTILGYLGSRLPISWSIAQRVNAVSAFLQAIAVVCFYCLGIVLLKQVHGRKKFPSGLYFVAFSASMYMAFSLIYWKYATKFEVFSLNNLLVVLLLILASFIGFRRGKRERVDKKGMSLDLRMLVMAFLVGFAFTHHQTVIFIFPAIMYLIWRDFLKIMMDLRSLSYAFLSFGLGLLPFFVLLIWIASRKPLLNWGDITDVDGVVAALVRSDFGTFSSYLEGFEPAVRPAPIEQVWYYLKNMVFDFSIIGILFVIVGSIYLVRKFRKMMWFVSLGFIVSGIVFLTYANFPLADSFNQSTVRRFHMLPNIFVALFLLFGLYYIYQKISEIKVKKWEYRLGLSLGKVFLILSFVFPLFMNFSKASHRGNNLTLEYAKHAFEDTPDNALVMLSGDIPNMVMDYYRFVELEGKGERMTFSPGQFHLGWFTDQLVESYPDLNVPLPEEGKYFTTTSQIVDANYGRWPIYVGPDLVVHDPELEQKYILYPKHLLFLVKKKGEDLKLEDWREENDRLWSGVDLDLMSKVQRNSPMFEETVIFHYARHFFNVGHVYEEVGLYEDAIREYERVLEISPFFKEALAALSRIYGEKMEQPDYYLAIDYLQKYQSVLRPGEIEFAYAAMGKIYEYQEKAMKEAEEEAKLAEMEKEMEATASGEEVEGEESEE